MPLDFNDNAARERDRRLRRAILQTLRFCMTTSPSGSLGAQSLADLVNGPLPSDQRFEDASHVIRLARELVEKNMVREKIIGLRRGERLELRHLLYAITGEGVGLLTESRPIDLDIDDDRVEVE